MTTSSPQTPNSTSTNPTTCERQICALNLDAERYTAPCVREAGHDGVCRYRVSDTLPDEDALPTTRDQIMVELRAYHSAVMELGADILALRERVARLEQETAR